MKSRLGITLGAASALAMLVLGGTAGAQERTLRMHVAFPTQTPVIGEITHWIAERIEVLSGGTLNVEVFEPGALVPATEYFDPVSKGAVDMAFGSPGYGAGMEPALTLYAAVPFGPDVTEYMTWMRQGSGYDIHEEIHAKLNLKAFICTITAPETAAWMKVEINSVADLQGLKMRYFGLGGRVLAKAGASIQLIPGGELYSALERGVIDGAEFSNPSIDMAVGLNKVTNYVYFPGWHQQVATDSLIINLDTWKALTDQQRAAIETTCGEASVRTLAQGASLQAPAIQALIAAGKPEIRVLPDEVLDALRKAWDEVAAEEAGKNEGFARALASYNEFRASYHAWQDLGYLKPLADK